MSKRLQVLFDDAELRRFRRLASGKGMTLSEWVRQTLRQAANAEPEGKPARKLAAVRAAARHSFPAPDIDQMLEEIARGYGEVETS